MTRTANDQSTGDTGKKSDILEDTVPKGQMTVGLQFVLKVMTGGLQKIVVQGEGDDCTIYSFDPEGLAENPPDLSSHYDESSRPTLGLSI